MRKAEYWFLQTLRGLQGSCATVLNTGAQGAVLLPTTLCDMSIKPFLSLFANLGLYGEYGVSPRRPCTEGSGLGSGVVDERRVLFWGSALRRGGAGSVRNKNAYKLEWSSTDNLEGTTL